MIKENLEKIIPNFLISWYHFLLAFFGAVLYGFPSKKMKVIGVTGTKGKTTTCNILAQILNFSGVKTGMATTVNFRIGEKEWANATKQTMLGRFKLQKLLSQMAKEGCEYAVIETSSEGILQHRHRFINYNIAVFTNLSPEHIERHGSFENYRKAKLKLFEKVAQKKYGIGIYNLDDDDADYFLAPSVAKKYGFTLKGLGRLNNKIQVLDVELSSSMTKFTVNNVNFETKIIGDFNVYNLAAAICTALSQNISIEKIKEALIKVKSTPGRLETIDEGQNFTVIVDYSYEATSLENALKSMRVFSPKRIIVVFGSAGGGRDKWRRPVMGEIADKYADIIIVTTDDPYNEDPEAIIKDIMKGVSKNEQRILNKNVFKAVTRKEAIRKALSLAEQGDLILFAGKGGELFMNVANSKKIPWNEAEIIREELKKIL